VTFFTSLSEYRRPTRKGSSVDLVATPDYAGPVMGRVEPSSEAGTDRQGFLARIGLRTPEHRAWAMYDWANSAVILTIVTAIFPIFFADFSGAGLPEGVALRRYAWASALALLIVAPLAPVLGAMADYGGFKKRFLGGFLAIGAGGAAGMVFLRQGDWLTALLLFTIVTVGAQGSFVFYESLLPHIARGHEMDRVSTAGYALGYLGSSILLALQILWIRNPALLGLPTGSDLDPATAYLPTRLAFLSVAVWWVAFSVPLFLRVREPAPLLEADERPRRNPARVALQRLRETFRELRRYRQAFLMLVAFLIYNDGIATIIKLSAIYGDDIGLGTQALIGAIFIAQLVGIPFAFLFGSLAGRFGPKRLILAGLVVYMGVSVCAYFLRTEAQFLALAVVVGMVQGGTQALSRSLFASFIPRHKSSEFFGFWSVLEKFAGVVGPALFATVHGLTGESRQAILSLIAFFVLGALLLTRVDVEAGRAAAREADRGLRPAG
jgi:MFS transporter, UMF1 family